MENKAPKKLQGWLVLFLISVVAALALAGTNELTKGAIKQRGLDVANAARIAVFADADAFEEMQLAEDSNVDNAYKALKGTEIVGYVAQATVKGYAGPVEVVVGMDLTGKVTAISVGGANFAETAGLGSKAKDPAFTDQFKELVLPANIPENVDAISGATVTSRAVVNGVNQAGNYMASVAGIVIEDKYAVSTQVEGNTATVTKDGFAGPVEVTVTVDDSKAITAIAVGGEKFAETPGYGAKAKEAAFTDQFIGKSGTLAYGDGVDAIAGATVTSNAVLSAVNEALAALRGEVVASEPKAEPTPVPEGRSAKAAKEGFAGPIEVVIIVDDAGKIVGITVGENASFSETPGLGTKVKDAAFTNQFIGQTGPFTLNENIDSIAGATWSSQGVVDAVNAALESLSGEPVAQTATEGQPVAAEGKSATITVDGFAGKFDVTVTVDDNGAISALLIGGDSFAETPGFGAKAKDEAFTSQFIGKSGTVTLGTDVDAIAGATVTSKAVEKGVNEALAALSGESAQAPNADPVAAGTTVKAAFEGFEGPIEAIVTVDADGKITQLRVGENVSFSETQGLGTKVKDEAFINQFIGKTGPFELGVNIDAVAGATFSSKAVVRAVNAALETLPVQASDVATGEERTAKAMKEGFAGPIEVVITVDDAGKILTMTVGENASFAETNGIGTKVKDEAFISQFLGKTGPFEAGKNVDTIAGATFSFNAVIEALNEALENLPPMVGETDGSVTAVAMKEGFNGPIEVAVTINAQGVITDMVVGENASFAETDGIGTKVKDAAFLEQFIGKTGPFEIGTNVDVITGATFSAKAVIEAVNAALDSVVD